MNIGEAKQEIKNAVRAYLHKNKQGEYVFPAVRQRPLMLMGPPGIGKTAVMEQISRELGICFVSYSMTHHTRQSVVGLPQIVDTSFSSASFSVTRYTMSEILASVYDAMKESGCSEGILFLDEINCVSETLTPTMLQFLQNKTFGTHALPLGWVIAAAGNPPEYNKSVREFDIATLDRIRTLEIQPDTEAFLTYATDNGLHNAVISYLKLYPERFYHVSIQEGKKNYVTARGWEDLSALLLSFDALGIPVTEENISQFLCMPETCRSFSAFYRLYRKYDADYAVSELLNGDENSRQRAVRMLKDADFVECFALVQMLLQNLGSRAAQYTREDETAAALYEALKDFLKRNISFEEFISGRRRALDAKQKHGLMSKEESKKEALLLSLLDEYALGLKENRVSDSNAARIAAQSFLDSRLQSRSESITRIHKALEIAISVVKEALGLGQELTALLSGIASDPLVMSFIAIHGCPSFLENCNCLQVAGKEAELQAACASLAEDLSR